MTDVAILFILGLLGMAVSLIGEPDPKGFMREALGLAQKKRRR